VHRPARGVKGRTGVSVRTAVCALVIAATVVVSAAAPPVLLEPLTGRQVFPATNWWNLDVSSAPLDGRSDEFISWIGGSTRQVHPDFGPPPYGIPYVVVAGDQARVPLTFQYDDESDYGIPGLPGYPVPEEAKTQPHYIEGDVPGGGTSGDRHLLIIDRDRWMLYEIFATRWNASASRWEGGSGAIFNLATNDRRPDTWTSADAAGLAILPGLVRHEEVFGATEIAHAFRFSTRATNGYVWPASHAAGSNASAPPMGTRLRMKASKDISSYRPEIQRIFRALKRHGLILADNGSDMYIQGTMDPRWDNGILNPAFHSLRASDFEVVQLGWRGPTGPVPSAPTNVRVVR
jgi:hypothetical protein